MSDPRAAAHAPAPQKASGPRLAQAGLVVFVAGLGLCVANLSGYGGAMGRAAFGVDPLAWAFLSLLGSQALAAVLFWRAAPQFGPGRVTPGLVRAGAVCSTLIALLLLLLLLGLARTPSVLVH